MAFGITTRGDACIVLLELKNVSYECNGNLILRELSLGIESNDFISIVGPSGSGKSTFLKVCCHLVTPTGGEISFKGKNILAYNPIEYRKSIGYCFQTPSLFGRHVSDNISFPFSIRNMKPDQKRIHELFSMFDIPLTFLEKDVKSLSGGEKQRIALIRTLMFQPEVLLLDEVTSALDTANTEIVEKVIGSLNKKGTCVLWITHNPVQSGKIANKRLTIESGEIKALEVLK